MADLIKKRFEQAEEVRPFPGGTGDLKLVDLGGAPVGLATFHAGWRWSEHIRPMAGTTSCEAPHAGYCLSGHMTVRMDDGREANIDPGDVIAIPPGHDAWVVGNEPCVVLDWQGFADYAKAATAETAAQA